MGIIIPLFGSQEQSPSEIAARRRMTRLDAATLEEILLGLQMLLVFDPVGFDVALPPLRLDPEADAELGEPVAVCGRCGGLVALFPEDLIWRHYRGAADVAGAQEPFDAGHVPAVEWHLLEDLPDELIAYSIQPGCSAMKGHVVAGDTSGGTTWAGLG